MRVVRVVTVLDFGGVEKRMVNIATAVPAGVKLFFVVLGKGGRASAQIEAMGHTVICLNHAFKIPNAGLVLKLTRLFMQLKPAVVHSSGAEANFHAQVAAYMAGVNRRISEEIGFPAHSAMARLIFKNVYRFTNRLVCISNAVAVRVVQLKEVKQSKTAIVYNPVIAPAVMPVKKKETGAFVFITICRLTAVKNLRALLAVFAKLQTQHTGVQLNIVGDGPEKHTLQQLALQLGIADKVTFVGFKADVYSELVKADVFILPSFSEGLGNAIMEAFIAGLPCIVSSVGGAGELVTPCVNGWLINPLDEGDILAKMQNALALPANKLTAMGENGRENIAGNFSLAKHWDALITIYKS